MEAEARKCGKIVVKGRERGRRREERESFLLHCSRDISHYMDEALSVKVSDDDERIRVEQSGDFGQGEGDSISSLIRFKLEFNRFIPNEI